MKQSRNHNNNNHNDNSNTTNTTNNDNNNRSSSSNHKNDGDFKKSIRREKSPKRQYFDTHIGIPLTVEELDFDSEDEDRNDQNIDEYTDVNVMSKDFMKLWNANTEIYGDSYVGEDLKKFIRKCGPEVLNKDLRYALFNHLKLLLDSNLIVKPEMIECMTILNTMETERRHERY